MKPNLPYASWRSMLMKSFHNRLRKLSRDEVYFFAKQASIFTYLEEAIEYLEGNV